MECRGWGELDELRPPQSPMGEALELNDARGIKINICNRKIIL